MIKVKKMITPLLGAFAIAVAFVSCGNKDKKGGQDDQVQTYKVETVITRDVTINATYPVTLEGKQTVEIRPKIDGYIQDVFVDEGATVKKGQLLFRIYNPQYEQSVKNEQAAVVSAEASVASAMIDVEKAKPLVAREIISKYELDADELTLKAKRAALAQAKADLATARANQGYTRVVSPANGVIGLIPNKKGSLVSSTSTNALTTVSDISKVYAYFSLNEKQVLDFSRQYAGTTLAEKVKKLPPVMLVLSDGSDYEIPGKVEAVSGLIDTETGSASFRAEFSNPQGLIRSGGSANIHIPKSYKSVLLIPQSATYELQNKRFVYVVQPNNKVTSVAIETTATDDGQYFIVNSGLKSGDKVVLEGVSLLKEGALIKPVEERRLISQTASK